MNFNGNTAHPCVDCGVLSIVTVTSGIKVNGKWVTWRQCGVCWRKDGVR